MSSAGLFLFTAALVQHVASFAIMNPKAMPQQHSNGNHNNLIITWERDMADRIRTEAEQKLAAAMSDGYQDAMHRPYMVSVVGIPGSGKTTSAEIVADLLSDVGCMLMPSDGYHIPMDKLRELPNAEDAIYRRGAVDTFDCSALMHDLGRIRYETEDTVSLPGFDHAKGDPEDNGHIFERNLHRVLICEGLYLLHGEDGWDKVSDNFDMTIFVDADVDQCMERVKTRNVCIPGYTPEEIFTRVDSVDRVNAMTVMNSKERATYVVQSATMK